jgi:esterase/lipase superfamily enzyme
MNIEYHKWWSPNLNQDMELKVYGHLGKPVIVFPTQGGRFYDFEDYKMVETISNNILKGKIKLFTVDSIDNQSWSNWASNPADRARRHEDYDRYIIQEVIPFAKKHCSDTEQKFMSTGVSMGAYHAANFFFRHPDVFDAVIGLSGLFQLRMFVGNYMDDNVYFNSPLNYLPNLTNPWYLEQYRKSQIIFCSGQGAWEEPMLEDAYAMQRILSDKQIPAWIDIWGYDVNHDWPWWRLMLPYFLDKLGFS